MKYIWLIIAGLCGGILGGMGMGGGTLLIPLLTLFCSIEQHNAQAFNLIGFIPMALIVLIIHYKNKLLDFKNTLYIIIPATASSVLTSMFVKKVDSKILSISFGIFLICLGIYQLIDSILKPKQKKK